MPAIAYENVNDINKKRSEHATISIKDEVGASLIVTF